MDWFEMNSHLRLLRSSTVCHHNGLYSSNKTSQQRVNGSAAATVGVSINHQQFVTSGQRLETLKSLRKLLKKFPQRLNNPSTVLSIFNVIKSILSELTGVYFDRDQSKKTNIDSEHPSHLVRCSSLANINIPQPSSKLKKTLSTDNVFIGAVRRNEILECIQIIIDLITLKFSDQSTNSVGGSAGTTASATDLEHGKTANGSAVPGQEEELIGRIFLPDIITLLGHESSDVQRNSIRFLQLYIGRTHNLQKTMSTFIEYGLQSPIMATQFGALNALPHLFVRKELRAENLGPVVYALGDMLVQTQTQKPHIFYPIYVALERINALIGSKRFYSYLFNCGNDHAVNIYETVQKRAPSPQVYIANTGFVPIDPMITNGKYTNGLNTGHSGQSSRRDSTNSITSNASNCSKKQLRNKENNKPGQANRKTSLATTTAAEETIMEEETEDAMMAAIMGINNGHNHQQYYDGEDNENEWSDEDQDQTQLEENVESQQQETKFDAPKNGTINDNQDQLNPGSPGMNHNGQQQQNEDDNDHRKPEQKEKEMITTSNSNSNHNHNYEYYNGLENSNYIYEQQAQYEKDDGSHGGSPIGASTTTNTDYGHDEEPESTTIKSDALPPPSSTEPEIDDEFYHQEQEQNEKEDGGNDPPNIVTNINNNDDDNNEENGEQEAWPNVDESSDGCGGYSPTTDSAATTIIMNDQKQRNQENKLKPRQPIDYESQNNGQMDTMNIATATSDDENDNKEERIDQNKNDGSGLTESNHNYEPNGNDRKQQQTLQEEKLVVSNGGGNDQHDIVDQTDDDEDYPIRSMMKQQHNSGGNLLLKTTTTTTTTSESNFINNPQQQQRHLNSNRQTKRNSVPYAPAHQQHQTRSTNIPTLNANHHLKHSKNPPNTTNIKNQTSSRQVTFANGYSPSPGLLNPNHKKYRNQLQSSESHESSSGLDESSEDDYRRNYLNHINEPLDNQKNLNNPKKSKKMATAATSTNTAGNTATGSYVGVPAPPHLASLTQLDADTLANLDYIPTMKDYYIPYYHPYYYDPLSYQTALAASYAAAAAAAATTSTSTVPPPPPPPPNPHLLRFGIFPRVLIYQALSSIAEEQFAAVQAIVRIVRDAPSDHLLLLLPHMDEFLSVFVAQLLLDASSNFKVILWTLDIIELLTERFKQRIHPNLSQMVLLLSQRLGDNRIVIRDSVIKVFHQMMSRYSAQEMLDLLFKHVSAQHHPQPLAFTSTSKLREEMANRVTASIATFPRAQLNLPKLSFDVAPFLIDRRALVRLASLECVATLAQALGPHKLGSLMTAVHSLESLLTAIDFDRLIASIQARLARRSLPRVGPDGNVQYVLRVPTSSESWYYRRIYDADLEWIALGPTTPPTSNVVPLLNTPTTSLPPPTFNETLKNGGDSSENSSVCCPEQPSITNNPSPGTKLETSNDERLARQQMSVNSADSEDIPPPVNSKVIVSSSSPVPDLDGKSTRRNRSRSRHQTKKINPDSMAQDPPSPMRNFGDKQQQREVEQRYNSLEGNPPTTVKVGHHHRSKTSQEYRPYGPTTNTSNNPVVANRSRRDHFIERLIRGESMDDSDLVDASMYFRRSSTESLEAWRQYFSRFKKQLADISLMGGGPYGSRPGSSIYHYGLSPLPPPPSTIPVGVPLSPSYYYYYYVANPLSGSYHDLSQLQQKNMLNIMKRSGFISSSTEQDNNNNNNPDDNGKNDEQPQRHLSDDDNSPKRKSQQQQKLDGRNTRNSEDNQSDRDDQIGASSTVHHHGNQLEPDPIPLERSFSMPSIRTDSSTETDHPIVVPISTGGNSNVGSNAGGPIGAATGSAANQISDEIIQEYGMWEEVIKEEKQQQAKSTVGEASPVVEEPSAPSEEYDPEPEIMQQASTQEQYSSYNETQPQTIEQPSIPIVSIQPSTPNIQTQIGETHPLQSGVNNNDDNNQNETVKEQSGEELSENIRRESIKQADETAGGSGTDDVISKDKQQKQEQSKPTAAGGKPGNTVSKTGPPGPPSRRLSRPPQQLYIKTTPAIPMNANIQHILGNVARTEGPFENAYEAVKAALIALRDHAWTTKVEGMLAVVRLATFHPHHLIRDQHQIALALASETRNLRSTVARSAIFTIGELFAKLRSQIEPEMDILTQALLTKVSENSVFIREDIDRALQLMIVNMPQTRAALALITYGSSHRNTHVRRTCAQFLSVLVEKMGVMKCLLGPRDIGEHLLPAAARFIQDHSAHTRYFGRRIFAVLMQHPLFDKFLRRHVSPGTYRNICGMLETIKRRGVGDAPSDLYSPTVQPKHSDPRRLVVIDGVTSPS